MLVGMGNKENPCANWSSHYGKHMEVPQKIKMELLFDTAIPLLAIYPKKPKTLIQKNIYMHIYVLCSFIYNSQDMEETQVPISR